ncbi:glycosyltransferase family 4 protein [Desulfosediminicola sp.]|uniref:glycosyltransferase family 4 protein n=1 Tax=Desulfosediminicola sp. TaxID=2886825 RepID=UPI003AF314B0
MKIAQVAPITESVPPKLYGGTERIVSFLTEELVRRGHDVTLFASGDSQTKARLCSYPDKAWRIQPCCSDVLAVQILQLERVFRELDLYDIVHFHTDYLQFPFLRRLPVNHVTTLHGRLDLPEHTMIFNEYREAPVVSISNNQRKALPMANWQKTVYNGIDDSLLNFNPESGCYLAFLGRITADKGVVEAIEIAMRSGVELKIAAKVDPTDQAYFHEKVLPLLDHPLINFIGEINEIEKSDFLGNAAALLFPIKWPEPFGLVMIEALACGTPVVAFNRGSVPEILQNFVTGFIVNSIEEAIASVGRLHLISRYQCRDVFERRFRATAMTDEYLDVYHQLISSHDGACNAGTSPTKY